MSALLWIVAHKGELFALFLAAQQFASLVVGLLPEAALRSRFGRALAWFSNLKPKDAFGTFKLPFAPHALPSEPAVPAVDGESSR